MKVTLTLSEACKFISERYSGAMVELVEDAPAPATPKISENQRMINFLEAIRSAVRFESNKITFIKLFRCAFGSGLWEAKHAIEQPEFAIEKLKSGFELKNIKFPLR